MCNLFIVNLLVIGNWYLVIDLLNMILCAYSCGASRTVRACILILNIFVKYQSKLLYIQMSIMKQPYLLVELHATVPQATQALTARMRSTGVQVIRANTELV